MNPKLLMTFYTALERVPGLLATETEWSLLVGPQFPAFKALCLQPSSYEMRRVRCARRCGCDHLVFARHGEAGVGVCTCEPPCCADIPLHPGDLAVLEVSIARLGRALCSAFGLAVRQAQLPVPRTVQFGAWSIASVPAILTIQAKQQTFRAVVAQLAAHLRQPFILFAPTSEFLDATSMAVLRNYGAAFFSLEEQVVLTERGTLKSTVVPGDLFAMFTPQPKETDMEASVRAFALVQKLDTDKPLPPPSLLTVFRRYCCDELSYAEIARKCKCTKTTIVRRASLIRRRTGLDLMALRRISPHLAKLESSLRDDRAERIRREYNED
jgi:hypothetical protein